MSCEWYVGLYATSVQLGEYHTDLTSRMFVVVNSFMLRSGIKFSSTALHWISFFNSEFVILWAALKSICKLCKSCVPTCVCYCVFNWKKKIFYQGFNFINKIGQIWVLSHAEKPQPINAWYFDTGFDSAWLFFSWTVQQPDHTIQPDHQVLLSSYNVQIMTKWGRHCSFSAVWAISWRSCSA